VWTEPYEDASRLGKIISVANAAYDHTRSPPLLLGVASIDVLVDELKAMSTDYEKQLQDLVARGKSCSKIQLS
jgi:hypothetical protein